MDERLYTTIGTMYRLASTYRRDVVPYRLNSIGEIFDFVKQIPYRRDNDLSTDDELLMRPLIGVIGGDCDDKSIFAGAALTNLGIPWHYVTTSYHPDREMEHVYLDVLQGGRWIPFDATYAHNSLGHERAYTSKLIWSNPMTVLEGYDGIGDDATLKEWAAVAEKFPELKKINFKDAAAITILAASPFLGPFGLAIGGVWAAALKWLGVRGKTAHVDLTTADAWATDFAGKTVVFYDSLPTDGKSYLASMIESWYKWTLSSYGTWWDAALNKIAASHQSMTYKDERSGVYWKCHDVAVTIIQVVDAETVQQDMKRWLIDPYSSKVFTPFAEYAKEKLGLALSTTGGNIIPPPPPPPSPAGGLDMKNLGVLVAAALGLLLIAKPARRSS